MKIWSDAISNRLLIYVELHLFQSSNDIKCFVALNYIFNHSDSWKTVKMKVFIRLPLNYTRNIDLSY